MFPREKQIISQERFSNGLVQTTICEITPGVNAYSGYVSLPAEFFSDLQDPESPYDINTFFWYFGT